MSKSSNSHFGPAWMRSKSSGPAKLTGHGSAQGVSTVDSSPEEKAKIGWAGIAAGTASVSEHASPGSGRTLLGSKRLDGRNNRNKQENENEKHNGNSPNVPRYGVRHGPKTRRQEHDGSSDHHHGHHNDHKNDVKPKRVDTDESVLDEISPTAEQFNRIPAVPRLPDGHKYTTDELLEFWETLKNDKVFDESQRKELYYEVLPKPPRKLSSDHANSVINDPALNNMGYFGTSHGGSSNNNGFASQSRFSDTIGTRRANTSAAGANHLNGPSSINGLSSQPASLNAWNPLTGPGASSSSFSAFPRPSQSPVPAHFDNRFGFAPQTANSTISAPPPGILPNSMSMVSPDSVMWLYEDSKGAQQGPFNGIMMQGWYKDGWLPDTLSLKRLEDLEYTTLGQFKQAVNNLVSPFLVPLPPSNASQHQASAPPQIQPVSTPGGSFLGWGDPFSGVSQWPLTQTQNLHQQVLKRPTSAIGTPVGTPKTGSPALNKVSLVSESTKEVYPVSAQSGGAATVVSQLELEVGVSSEQVEEGTVSIEHAEEESASIEQVEETAAPVQPVSKQSETEEPVKKSDSHVPEVHSTPLASLPRPAKEILPSKQLSSVTAPWANANKAVPSSTGTLSMAQIQQLENKKKQEHQAKQKAEKQKSGAETTQASPNFHTLKTPTTVVPSPGLPSVVRWANNSPSTVAKQKTLAEIQQEEMDAKKKEKENETPTSSLGARIGALPSNKRYADVIKSNNLVAPNLLRRASSTSTVPIAAAPAVAAQEDQADGWTTVTTVRKPVAVAPAAQPVHKIVNKSSNSSLNSPVSGSSKMSGSMGDFVQWCKSAIRGLNPGVNQGELLGMLLSLPSSADSKDIIADIVYSHSSTMDGRRFAEEFLKRKQRADPGNETEGKTWSDLIQKAPVAKGPANDGWNSNFNVVRRKK